MPGSAQQRPYSCRSYAVELLPAVLLGLTDEAADIRTATMEGLQQIAEQQDDSAEKVCVHDKINQPRLLDSLVQMSSGGSSSREQLT